MIKRFFTALCLLTTTLCAELTVDLCNPVYCDGELTTVDGGVITGPNNLRIQAQRLTYFKQEEEEKVIASGNLILEYHGYLFVGEQLEYDFQTNTGVIICGKTGMPPWFLGAQKIILCPDGSFFMEESYLTTSESCNPAWRLSTKTTRLSKNQDLCATDVTYRLGNFPLFWVPKIDINLNSIFDSPVRYKFRWGGRQGPRIGMQYELLNWNGYKTFLRLDYRLNRGIGGGLESCYHSKYHKQSLETINYVAQDSSLQDPKEKTRYRLQGVYHQEIDRAKLHIDVSWDKLSDRDMATDYCDKGLQLDTAGRTQVNLWRQDCFWTTNLLARVRANEFQSMKQELPTFEASHIPLVLGKSGIIMENKIKASFLDFDYSDDQPDIPDYHSPRVEMEPFFSRPIQISAFTISPEAAGTFIFYGNSQNHHTRWLMMGRFSGEVDTTLHHIYGCTKHVAIPYARYEYFTFPSASPTEHFIFDINDGLYRLNKLRFGFRNHLYCKTSSGNIQRLLYADIFTNAFFDTETIPTTIPKVYADVNWYTSPRTRIVLNTAWDFEHDLLDHINVRNEWTLSEDAAVAIEYRHRSRYDWKKVEKQNFILDSFRSDTELVNSALSDHRDTLLVHLFYRFTPSWALEYQSRYGWNRENARPYGEFNVNLQGTFSSAWHFKMAYRHKENEDRIAFYLTVGMSPPSTCAPCITPWAEF